MEDMYSSLETDDGMRAFVRETFVNGVVPILDKDAKDAICRRLIQVCYSTGQDTVGWWSVTRLIDAYAERILTKVWNARMLEVACAKVKKMGRTRKPLPPIHPRVPLTAVCRLPTRSPLPPLPKK